MLISIITVCYNSSKTIEDTIKSVLSQTYKNVEYIVVDGGSNDNTNNIILKYRDGITHYVSEPDKGLYDAMNKALELATGDLIGILNSDDIFHDNSVLESVATFHNRNIIQASISDVLYKNNKGKIVRKYSAENWCPEKIKSAFMPPHAGIFFKKHLFKDLGNYKLDYIIAADFELITRFFLKNKISWKYLNINTTLMSTGGISSSGLKSYRIISKEIKKALSSNNIKCSYLKIQLRLFNKLLSLIKN
jgi:glycosyltransferase involved in cell wall biosynthesis